MLTMQRPTVEALGDEEDNRQRFAIGPLEPGFGHTIGNSLRRTLLSSVPGAAITQVKFDGEAALHEFATIEGVVEDVTDLILNIKDIVLTSFSDEPLAVRIDASGPCDFTAGDVEWGADVECHNPDLHIATLSASGRLALDVTIQQGRGYLSSEDQDSSLSQLMLCSALSVECRLKLNQLAWNSQLTLIVSFSTLTLMAQ